MRAIQRSYTRGHFIFATCNSDVLHHLQPDIVAYVHEGKVNLLHNINAQKKNEVI